MVRRTGWACLAAALALAGCGSEPAPVADTAGAEAADAAARIEAHVAFLADDLLEGREAGTRGYDLAAHYVATQFRLLGLEPAGGDGGWYQSVPMLRGVRQREGALFAIERDGRRIEFAFEDAFFPGANYAAPEYSVTAPMVFVGYAVHAPELDWDDFATVDVKGKVAVLLSNAPARFPPDQRAFHASSNEKLRELESRGAVGYVFLQDPDDEARRPWERDAPNWGRPGMRLVDAAGQAVNNFPGLLGRASLRVSQAGALLEGSAVGADELWEIKKRGEMRSFDLAGTVTLAGRAAIDRVDSNNVVAKLAGSYPALAPEHVVLSAHLDHVGIGAPHAGDTIYNGALDNALGVAILLEAARGLRADAPKRSILFLALTAEEKGLLGAYRFAGAPTVPADSLVANVNMDMPVILTPQSDAIAWGIEHSSLQAVVERAAQGMGVTLTPDPFPEEVVFIRSDQYPFIRAGVPAVFLGGGVTSTDPAVDGKAQLREFQSMHYHLPSDDLTRSIHWPTAARLAELNRRIAREIADTPQRPAWNAGDFFGDRFGRKDAPTAGE
jgi:Zn-dependent M28 family amino/carboxypeptidase